MGSREEKTPTPDAKQPSGKRSNDRTQADEQNQATSEDFEEEGMGVAPKE